MIELNLWDNNFEGQTSAVPGKAPRHVRWIRNRAIAHPDVRSAPTIHTDWMLEMSEPDLQHQYAWLLESPASKAGKYARSVLPQLEQRFEAIFTSERALVSANPARYRYAPVGGIWVKELDHTPTKTQLVSMLTSTKIDTELQRIRQKLAAECIAKNIPVFGRGRREVETVEDALAPFMFSVAVENVRCHGYWSEKLLNCFATGTVPLYLGAPDIGRYFDDRGILSIEELDDVSPLRYAKLVPYVTANMHEALKYEIPDDRLVLDHFSGQYQIAAGQTEPP